MNEYNYLFKFILVGDINVGKSSILLQFTEERSKNNYEPTIGVEFGSKVVDILQKTIKLQIWDTAGQESYRSIIRSYYRGCVGVLLVFDLTSRSSFESIRDWLEEVTESARSEVIIVLVGNKCDLDEREVHFEEIEALSQALNLHYFETSAFTGLNVKETFEWLSRNVLEKIFSGEIDPSNKEFGIRTGGHVMMDLGEDLSMKKGFLKKKNGCCC